MIERLEHGRWKVTVDVGPRGPGGRVSRTIRGGRRAAEHLERDLKAGAYAANDRPDPTSVTVAEVVDRYIMENRERWKPNTRIGYENKLTNIIRPAFGKLRAAGLDVAEVEAGFAALERGQRVGDLIPRRKLAAATTHGAHRLLKSAFRDAERTRYLRPNPYADVRPPTVGKHARGRLDPKEVAAVIHAATARKDADLVEVIQLALATGARPGELAALRWRDVTLTTGVVSFLGVSSPNGAGGIVRVDSLKADESKTLRVDDGCRLMLEARYRRHCAQAEAAGLDVEDVEEVAVCSRLLEADRTSSAALAARFRRAAEAAPSDLRFYDLRRLAGSAMLRAGLNPIVAAERLGHSVTMLLDVYGRGIVGDDDRAATILGDVWTQITTPDA